MFRRKLKDHTPCYSESKINETNNFIFMNENICKENQIPFCSWNYLSTPNDGNRFSLVDDDTRKILSKRMLKIIQGRAK
jgi:hypothetical protein